VRRRRQGWAAAGGRLWAAGGGREDPGPRRPAARAPFSRREGTAAAARLCRRLRAPRARSCFGLGAGEGFEEIYLWCCLIFATSSPRPPFHPAAAPRPDTPVNSA